jgi:hypothetical protein
MFWARIGLAMKHQFAIGFVQAVSAPYPFAFRALMLSAVEFTEGVLLWNFLDELVENTVRKPDGRFAVTPHGPSPNPSAKLNIGHWP